MQKNPYLVLGLDKNATEAEIKEAYSELKARYSEERFLEGEAGMKATKMLSDLEAAYNHCMDDVSSRIVIKEFGSQYGNIKKLIDGKDYDGAQSMLDRISARDAEWHYYQANVYYKRGWLLESKKQMEIAVALEPDNGKYSVALQKITASINTDPYAGNPNPEQQSRAGYERPAAARGGARNGDACCNTCCTLLCLDSCCECCGGDLISCC